MVPVSGAFGAATLGLAPGGVRTRDAGAAGAIALEFARHGADILALDIAADIDGRPVPMATPADLASPQGEIEAMGRACTVAAADIPDRAAQREAIASATGTLAPAAVFPATPGVRCVTGATIDVAAGANARHTA